MTAPTSRVLHAALDAEEQALAESLRALGESAPSPALDARIRTEARAALRKRPFAVWGASLAAVLALGVGVRVTLAPTELAVPISPAQHAPMETPTVSPHAAPVEARAAAEAERAATQDQPADTTAAETTQPATAGGLTPAPEPPAAKSTRGEREQDADTPLSAGSTAAGETMNEDTASDPTSSPEQAYPVLLDETVPHSTAPSPAAFGPATPPTRPTAPPVAEHGTRPNPVVTAVTPVSVPTMPDSPAEPAPSPMPDAFPPTPGPVAAAPAPATEMASPRGTDRRERNAPAALGTSPADVEAAKRDQEADAMPPENASLRVSGRAQELPRKAQAGAPARRPTPSQAEAASKPTAAETVDEATFNRATESKRISGEPTLEQLIQRARQAH
ncbi:MAG: hypothetical protein ACT4NL_18540, partial [Pseudomarimonas sp.]